MTSATKEPPKTNTFMLPPSQIADNALDLKSEDKEVSSEPATKLDGLFKLQLSRLILAI